MYENLYKAVRKKSGISGVTVMHPWKNRWLWFVVSQADI